MVLLVGGEGHTEMWKMAQMVSSGVERTFLKNQKKDEEDSDRTRKMLNIPEPSSTNTQSQAVRPGVSLMVLSFEREVGRLCEQGSAKVSNPCLVSS